MTDQVIALDLVVVRSEALGELVTILWPQHYSGSAFASTRVAAVLRRWDSIVATYIAEVQDQQA